MARIAAGILICLLAVGGTAAQEPGGEIEAALRDARAMLNSNQAAGAIAKLQPLEKSGDKRVAQLLGVAYYQANNLTRAIETLEPVVGQFPADSPQWREATQILGLSHYILGHLVEAVPYIERTLKWSPDNVELTYALGMAAIQTRDPARARQAFARMFRVPADSAASHLLTAQMMIRVDFEDFAVAELKKALELDPRLPQANYLLGQTAIYKGRFDEGIEYLKKELEVNPGNSNAYYKIGDALTRQLQWDEAIPALQKSIWINPWFSGPYILLGKSYLKKGQLSNAEGMLRRAIQFDPNNKSAHYLLGQVLQRAGRMDEARREFEIADKLQGSAEQPDR